MRGEIADASEASGGESLFRGAAAICIIAAGAFLRLYGLGHESLVYDEAAVANPLVRFKLVEILTIPFHSKEPLLYLTSQRCIVLAFGHSEFVLRLLPSLFGIGTLVLLYLASRKTFAPDLALYVTALASFSPPLIDFSRFFRQYTCEAFFATALFFTGMAMLGHGERRWAFPAYVILSTLAVGFSYCTVFILVGINAAFLANKFMYGEMPPLKKLVCAGLYLFALWFLMYKLYLSRNLLPDTLACWERDFANTQSLGGFGQWFWAKLTRTGVYFFPVPSSAWIVLPAVLLSGVTIWRPKENGYLNTCFLATLLSTFSASLLHLYPIGNRLMLFLCPLCYLVLAKGVSFVARLGHARHWHFLVYGIASLLPVQMLSSAVGNTLLRPQWREEMRPVVRHLERGMRATDRILVYYGAAEAFTYYYTGSDTNVAYLPPHRTEPRKYLDDLNALTGDKVADRLWLVVSHYWRNEHRFILKHMKRRYPLIFRYERTRASLYCFDTRRAPAGAPPHALSRETTPGR